LLENIDITKNHAKCKVVYIDKILPSIFTNKNIISEHYLWIFIF